MASSSVQSTCEGRLGGDRTTRVPRCLPSPYAMHTPCTRHAHAMHTPCTRHAHAMHTPCTRHVHVHVPCTCTYPREELVALYGGDSGGARLEQHPQHCGVMRGQGQWSGSGLGCCKVHLRRSTGARARGCCARRGRTPGRRAAAGRGRGGAPCVAPHVPWGTPWRCRLCDTWPCTWSGLGLGVGAELGLGLGSVIRGRRRVRTWPCTVRRARCPARPSDARLHRHVRRHARRAHSRARRAQSRARRHARRRARRRARRAEEYGREVNAVEGAPRGQGQPRQRGEGGEEVELRDERVRGSTRRDVPGPHRQSWLTMSTLPRARLACRAAAAVLALPHAHKRRVVTAELALGVAAAVVSGEEEQRLLLDVQPLEHADDPAHRLVELAHSVAVVAARRGGAACKVREVVHDGSRAPSCLRCVRRLRRAQEALRIVRIARVQRAVVDRLLDDGVVCVEGHRGSPRVARRDGTLGSVGDVLGRITRVERPVTAVGVGAGVVGAPIVVRHAQAEEGVEAVRAWHVQRSMAKVPLARHAGHVARLLEERGDGDLGPRQPAHRVGHEVARHSRALP
eukprot:scaffold6371_cov70-Phaeocystis_antarctica.AAC.4